MIMMQNALLLIFPAAMIFAAVMDLFTMTIPNRISIALIAGFAILAVVTRMPLETVGWHVATGAGMLVLGIFMFSRNWLGGGDAKLLAAAALWIGLEQFPLYIGVVCMAGAVLTIVILLYRAITLPEWFHGQEWAMRLHDKKGGVPYGIAIAAGALWIYPSTFWFASLAALGT